MNLLRPSVVLVSLMLVRTWRCEDSTIIFSACHHYQDLEGYEIDYSHYRKKRSTEEEGEAEEEEEEEEEEQKATLIDFFTECMTNTSNVALDWYSATDWAIEDSNWYYYTESSDCDG